MRGRSLAVMAALVLALGAFIWLYERDLPTTAERETHGKRVFGDLEADDVRGVTLEQGGRTVRLVREAPERRNLEHIEKSRANTQRHLAMLNRHLQGFRFVAGDEFSVADIPVGIYAYRWYTFEGIERDALPALERWYAELQTRAPYRTHVMVGLA